MQKIGINLRRKSMRKWNETASKIKETYGIQPFDTPREIYIEVEGSEINQFQPGVLREDSLIINKEIVEYEKILPITITKLCFQSSLPTDILCEDCNDDLSFEYARREIEDESLREKWETIWSKHKPPRKISTTTEYYPLEGYRWLYSVAGDNGLDTFVKELTNRVRNQIPLSFDDYLQYFTKRIQRFERTLSSTELKLIRAVIEHPNLQATELAKIVGITEEWTSIKLAQLQKRMVLRKFNRAPFSRIGIQMYRILINRGIGEIEPLPLLKQCPFLYSYRKVVSGDCIALATLTIPDNKESTEYIRNGLKLVEGKGFTIDVHRISTAGMSHCFDYYIPEVGQWNIPWELLEIHLQRIQSDNLASSMPRVDQSEQKIDLKLDDLDMKIFQCIRKGITSVSKIRAHLRVGQHRVAARLQKLRENGLIVKSWEAHNIGLSEHILIYSKNKKIGKTLAAWSLRLPKCTITFSSDEELLLIADLPKGGVFGLSAALEGLNNNTCVGILSPQTYGSWGFPSPLWDSKFQKWKCPKKKLESWISQLE